MIHSKMKDSGINWIGQVPQHWQVSSINKMTKVVSIKNHPAAELLSVYRDFGVIPKSSRDDNHNRASEDLTGYKYVKKGFLVINKMKAWQGSLGVSNYNGIVSPAYIICKVNKNIKKEYLHYLLRNKIYIQFYNSISYGVRVDQWDMRYDDFKYTPILVPPSCEQTAIANYLDYHTAKIDMQIDLLEKKVKLLEDYKQSLIYETITKGLDKNVTMKNSGIEWIGMIPEHWEVSKFNKQLKIKIKDGPHETPTYVDKGIPFLTIGDLKNNRIDLENVKSKISEKDFLEFKKKVNLKKGDILFSKSATIGKVAIVPEENFMIWSTFAVLRFKQNINSKFIFYLLQSSAFINYAIKNCTQNTQNNLGMDKLSKMIFPFCDLTEQQEIVSYLDDKYNKIDNKKELINKKIELLKKYKQSLIYEATTGKISV